MRSEKDISRTDPIEQNAGMRYPGIVKTTSKALRVMSALAFGLLCGGVSAPGQWQPTSEQLAYYALDGDLQDASGYGLHATGQDIVFGADRRHELDKASELNGSSGHVRLPAGLLPGISGSPTLTVMLWIRPEELNRRQTIFAFTTEEATQPGDPLGILLQLDEEGRPGVQFKLDTDLARASEPLLPNQWQHIGLVFDGAQMDPTNRVRIFVNGTPRPLEYVQPAAIPTVIGSLDYSATLGGHYFPSSGKVIQVFRGGLDEVRLLKTAWSPNQIKLLFRAERGLYLEVRPALVITASGLQPTVAYQLQGSDDGLNWIDVVDPIPLGDFAVLPVIGLAFGRFHRYYRLEELPDLPLGVHRLFGFDFDGRNPGWKLEFLRVNQLGEPPSVVLSVPAHFSAYPVAGSFLGGGSDLYLDTSTSFWLLREVP